MRTLTLVLLLGFVCGFPSAVSAQLTEEELRELYERGNPQTQQPPRAQPPEQQSSEEPDCVLDVDDCVSVETWWMPNMFSEANGDFNIEVTNTCPLRLIGRVCLEVADIRPFHRNQCDYIRLDSIVSDDPDARTAHYFYASILSEPTGRYDMRWVGSRQRRTDQKCQQLSPGFYDTQF